jgi:hypothetical protein
VWGKRGIKKGSEFPYVIENTYRKNARFSPPHHVDENK